VIPLWANPEFIRNCRAQLRPRRLILVASVAAVLSITVAYSMSRNPYNHWRDYLNLVLIAQMIALIGGGGISTGLSIFRERERNTFDFQRVTQLSAFELAIGKLFGAPALAYFVALCLVPAALWGALGGGTPLSLLAGSYLLMVTLAIAFHAVALLYSMGATRAGTGAAGLGLALFVMMGASAWGDERSVFDLGSLGPNAVTEFAVIGTWQVLPPGEQQVAHPLWTDAFFGMPVHHVPVLVFLYVTFTVWCLLPLVRNLKKDPAIAELLSPAQSVGLLFYLNFIAVGFFMVNRPQPSHPWDERLTLSTALQFFLEINLVSLYLLGLSLLRNREQVRRRAHQRGGGRFDWLEAGWPAVCVLAGAALVGALVVARFELARGLPHDLNVPFAVFRALMLLTVIVRDLSFFQWMNLRRTSRPLILAIVLIGVFYTCGALLASVAGSRDLPNPYVTAVFLPWTLLPIVPTEWAPYMGAWVVGLAVQVSLAVRPAGAPVPAGAEAS
jgi:hypothetical protein